MISVQQSLLEITQVFRANGIENPRQHAEYLLCDALSLDLTKLYSSDFELSSQQQVKIHAWTNRRLQGEPLAYIHGQMHFYGCVVKVTPCALIPRQETEVLVDKIAQQLNLQDLQDKILLDLCCGTGCIGIALKKKFPELTVYLSDLSVEALTLAKENAQLNRVKVCFLQGDLLEPFKNKKAHFLVCNPPYISSQEYHELDKEVRAFEPRLALEAGETGLEIYQRLAFDLPTVLHPSARVWFEIGYQQGEAVKNLFNQSNWIKNEFEKDWAGHPRFFFLENE